MAAEAEAVFHGFADLHGSGLEWDVIEIAAWIRIVQIDRRWSSFGLHGLKTEDRFDTAGGTQQMTELALGA